MQVLCECGANGKQYLNLDGQIKDYEKLFVGKEKICIIGDLNITFSGHTWPSKYARATLCDAFEKYTLLNITNIIDKNVNHIVISKSMISQQSYTSYSWNTDFKLSDHIGISIDI